MIALWKRHSLMTDSVNPGIEIAHPQLRALHELWERKRGLRTAPSRADFSVEELRPWLGHLIMVDCLDDDDFRFRLYGTALVRIFGFDLTNRLVSDVSGQIGDRPAAEYRQVRRLGTPFHVARRSPSAREYLTMDKLALPLMDNGVVTKIMAAIYHSDSAGS